MTTLSDVKNVHYSGFNHIDALVDSGPDWNFLASPKPYLSYTFSIASGNEEGQGGQSAFSPVQQVWTRKALAYLSAVTGVQFQETAIGSAAQIHLALIDIVQDDFVGLTSWRTYYTPPRSTAGSALVTDYSASAYVYLDNKEYRADTADLTPGGEGYQVLLHELGHMMGLAHPFEGDHQLPYKDDHTDNTLMSYDHLAKVNYSTYSPYDIAAFNWIYGGDGLRGKYGTGGSMDYFTGRDIDERISGTGAGERIDGAGGDDSIDGLAGFDEAGFGGLRANYDITRIDDTYVVTDRVGDDGRDVLSNIEALVFADRSVALVYESVVQALYVGYFGRAADYNGMQSFQQQLSALGAPTELRGLADAYGKNIGLRGLIDSFASSAESAALYPGNTGTFIKALYQNVFGRAPDAGGLAFWSNAIDSGGLSRANASLSIMAGALDNKTFQGILDAKLVNNKLSVASGFTLMIDTAAEIAGYSGAGAAATVRSMLGNITTTTDLLAYQATIGTTLKGMSTATLRPADALDHDLPIVHAELIGIGYQNGEATLV
jgi:serralysin